MNRPLPHDESHRTTGPRRHVALVGHVCSPAHGSEPGFTWNWAKALAAHHDVCVFSHPAYRRHVDEELATNPVAGLEVTWVNLNSFDPWRPERGESGLQLHYQLWQRA